MKLPVRLSVTAIALSALCALAVGAIPTAASAASPSKSSPGWPLGSRAVFVQTNAPTGNQIDAFDRGTDGRLTQVGTYSTGGNGASESGAVVDTLASQNSLVYNSQGDLLYAVNAGSNTISVFFALGAHLVRLDVISSGGQFPVSIATHGKLVYVLNAGGAGNVTGFVQVGPSLDPLPNASQSLGLSNTTPPNYLMGPGEIGFTPSGGQLIVTTKASTSDIDVFSVGRHGQLSAPVANASTTPVPFSFTWGPNGQLVVAEAKTSNVSTYLVNSNGTLTAESTLTDGQAALCWITEASGFDFVANAGSNSLSAYQVSSTGGLSLVGSTGVVASTDTGPIDIAATPGGRYIYSEDGGAGAVDEFAVNSNGTLTAIGTVEDLGAGIEGIATN
ncbi:MAG: hypothetical protein WAM97_07355 [Acidimicrobiales bacterium]